MDIVDCCGTADERVGSTGVLVEPEEGYTMDAMDGIERGLVGVPCSVETCECDDIEVVDIAPRRCDA